jgi:hypothetical protein
MIAIILMLTPASCFWLAYAAGLALGAALVIGSGQ